MVPDDAGGTKTVGARFSERQVTEIDDAAREGETRADFVHRVVMDEVENGYLDQFIGILRYVAGGAFAVFLVMFAWNLLLDGSAVAMAFSGVLASTLVISWGLAKTTDYSFRIGTGQ